MRILDISNSIVDTNNAIADIKNCIVDISNWGLKAKSAQRIGLLSTSVAALSVTDRNL
jgi:hypothetical protein